MTNYITYENWNESEVTEVEKTFHEAIDVLKWSYSTYEKDIVYACSFGAEAIVLIDLITKVKKKAKLIFLDTNLHFQETYDLIEKVRRKYSHLQIELIQPDLTLEEQAMTYGENLWETDPHTCCHLRKVVPLKRGLIDVTAWISGLRREQSPTRRKTNYINKDDTFQAVKICPLIHWTWKDVWQYIVLHELDYNVLHDNGYPSIGCAPCTQQATDPNDSRSGRWAQFSKTECGLHFDSKGS